jgi:beta-hydroxyacyl-ACP dehydratase FabZ
MEADDLLCSRNARPQKALVGRAQWKINQPLSLEKHEQAWKDHLSLVNEEVPLMSVMEQAEIQSLLPHRYPFLLVDRVQELDLDRRIVGIKNVTINEPFFQGHFPGRPVMPGVLILEAMAQVGAILAFKSMGHAKSPVVYLTGIDGAKFRKPVVPGDRLRFEIEVIKKRAPFWKMQGKAFVEEELVCEAEVTAMVTEEKAESRQ